MRQIFTLKNWSAWLIFNGIFLLDNVCSNLWKWKYGEAVTLEEFYRNIQILCLMLSVFGLVPYLMLTFRVAPVLHKWDRWIIGVGILSCLTTIDDYTDNYNLRATWFDWYFFYGLIFVFTILKICTHAKIKKNL